MPVRYLFLTLLFATFSVVAVEAQTVRVIYYSGNVTVTSGGKTSKVRLGQSLKSSDRVKIGNSSSVQFSCDGKVLRYTTPTTVSVSRVISRAGQGENSVVANSARTLAGASGSGRSSRTSVAGATRFGGNRETPVYFDSIKTEAVNTGTMRLNTKAEAMTGIENPIDLIKDAAGEIKGEALILLQPRSTSVSSGPIRFRWLDATDVNTYVVTVKNYVGDVLYRTETSDTTVVWEAPDLKPGVMYSWRLTNKENALNTYGATFHLLPSDELQEVEEGVASIREELGENNPALPMVLGAFYSDHGCYGQAAELFADGAESNDEHAALYREMECEQYLYNMFVPVEECYRICR